MSARQNDSVRLACGSAFGDDRISLAVDMAARGNVSYICLDGLAERTLALAHQRRDPVTGEGSFDVRIPELTETLLPVAVEKGITLIANMGAANPAAAGRYVAEQARNKGLKVRVAVIEGDDVTSWARDNDPIVKETGRPVSELPGAIIAANAYTGADSILEALEQGATVILGGRLADPSLYVAPIAYELGWSLDSWDRIGAATAVGHLLECGGHVTGGNFADPPYRVVESFQRLSMPLAEVRKDGTAVVSKLADTDGLLNVETCKVQLGYEIHDPENYLTPDVTADFRNVTLTQTAEGVAVAGATGRARPEQLKALVAMDDGFLAEAQVSFAGPGALARAQLAETIVKGWLEEVVAGGKVAEIKTDLLGINSMLGPVSEPRGEPWEVHLRLAARCLDRHTAQLVAEAGQYIQVCGPAAVGGHRMSIKPVVGMYTFFVPREAIKGSVHFVEA
ncbi:MAG: hypothetical protein QOK05_2020 [Chloroflexota bacterium]|nr:hypothetical protein [Chloroflexota bacterium]